ncbi:MAG: hypothetical protein P8013_15295 [Candidatus Sulfobium sp.]
MLRRVCITLMILIIMFLCPLIASADGGVHYLGELCVWTREYGSFAPPGIIARLGVLSYGEGHFALQGSFVNSGGLLHGTAEINDAGEIVISLTGTDTTVKATDDLPQPGSSTTAYAVHMVVDPASMTGHYRIIASSWENELGSSLLQPIDLVTVTRGLSVDLLDSCPR